MKHGSLFSGIGGFDIAAEWAGWENIFHCEWNPFGQKVLKHYWPNATSYTDITKTDFTIHRGAIDVLTGGFPCQPYSLAGKRKGKEDERHLWPEMLRAVREVRPSWVVGENVFGLVNWSGGLVFHEVQTDLEDEGYEVWPYVLPACAKDAPHRRDRIWFVAYANNDGRQANTKRQSRQRQGIGEQYESIHLHELITNPDSDGQHRSNSEHEKQPGEGRLNALNEVESVVATDTDKFNRWGGTGRQDGAKIDNGSKCVIANTSSSRRVQNNEQQRTEKLKHARTGWDGFPTQSPLCSRNDGLSGELAGITFSKHRAESIKAYGNAIVPAVAYELFKAINKFELL